MADYDTYELTYSHPYFREGVDDSTLHHRKTYFMFGANTDEEAIQKAEEFTDRRKVLPARRRPTVRSG
jgi:hypothetical protein